MENILIDFLQEIASAARGTGAYPKGLMNVTMTQARYFHTG